MRTLALGGNSSHFLKDYQVLLRSSGDSFGHPVQLVHDGFGREDGTTGPPRTTEYLGNYELQGGPRKDPGDAQPDKDFRWPGLNVPKGVDVSIARSHRTERRPTRSARPSARSASPSARSSRSSSTQRSPGSPGMSPSSRLQSP